MNLSISQLIQALKISLNKTNVTAIPYLNVVSLNGDETDFSFGEGKIFYGTATFFSVDSGFYCSCKVLNIYSIYCFNDQNQFANELLFDSISNTSGANFIFSGFLISYS